MAIKERKQITGTTEQINAYAGHEGQIVWDKEKNTLVGMSGTAGTNYPLATEEALNEKEDAGVCLPLTGGNMTGNLLFNNMGAIVQDNSAEYEQVLFQAYDTTNSWVGGMLACRGHSGSNETDKGSFALGARAKDASITSFLVGTPAGGLSWAGNEVLRITGIGDGWVRFNPNIQICFGSGQTTSEGSVTVSFGAPFSFISSITTSIIGGNSGADYTVLVDSFAQNTFKAGVQRNGALEPRVSFCWYAIGYY
jgi:hypothetical protein